MQKVGFLTLIHADNNNKYITIRSEDIDEKMKANEISVELPIPLAPNWEKQGMQVIASDFNKDVIAQGLVKNLMKSKRRTDDVRVYKLMKDSAFGLASSP